MKFIDVIQGSEEWHAARAGVTTASTFATAVSKSGGLTEQQAAYVAAIQAGKTETEAMAIAGYKAKPKSETVSKALAGLRVTEPSEASTTLAIATAIERISGKPYGDTFETFAMRRGAEQEAFARMRYEARFETFVEEAGLALTDDGKFGYSTDGFVGDDGCIEIKVPLNTLKILRIIETGDISEYIHQIQGGLWLTGRKWCDFVLGVPDLAVLNNGNDLFVKRVHRDEDFIEALEADLLEFDARVTEYEFKLRTPFKVAA